MPTKGVKRKSGSGSKLDFLAGRSPFQDHFVVAKRSGKKKKPQPLKTLDKMHEHWFFGLSPKVFKKICDEWNEVNLKLEIEDQPDYDHWFNYFKTVPASHIRMLVTTGQDILSAEAYSAVRMWHDIISHPYRINKIHQSGLTAASKGKKFKTILERARDNDRLGVLEASRDKIAEKLDKGAGNRDTAALTREMSDIMAQIDEYKRRAGPEESTVLARLLKDSPAVKAKRPGKNGGGARNTSFKSRVTIKDTERV